MGDPAGATSVAAPGRASSRALKSSSGRSPRADGAAAGVRLLSEGGELMREGTKLFAKEGGEAVGRCTSGCFGPNLDAPVAMGYVPIGLATPGTRLLTQLAREDAARNSGETACVKTGYKRA